MLRTSLTGPLFKQNVLLFRPMSMDPKKKKAELDKKMEIYGRVTPIDREKEKEMPTYQFAAEKTKKYNRVYVWGNAQLGALGQEGFNFPKKKRNVLKYMHKPFRQSFAEFNSVTSMACGYGFTLFATKDKKKPLCGTGVNQSGQIGFHKGQRGKPLEVLVSPTSIDLPLGEGEVVTKVAAGRAHSLVLTNKGSVLSLGNNAYGQCGRPVIEQENYFLNRVVHRLRAPEVVTDATCGQDHTILRTQTGKLWSCGWGADGQTGLGHYNNQGEISEVLGDISGENIVKVACAGDCVLALSEKGEVFGWGNSEYGQLKALTDEQQISTPTHIPLKGLGKMVDIASGGTVCLILNDAGDVFVWGYGILGKGPDLKSSSEPELIPATLFGRNELNRSSRVVGVYAGIGHQAALTDTGDLYTWGKNRGACLGLGDELDQYFPFKVCIGGRVTDVAMGVDHTVVMAKPWA